VSVERLAVRWCCQAWMALSIVWLTRSARVARFVRFRRCVAWPCGSYEFDRALWGFDRRASLSTRVRAVGFVTFLCYQSIMEAARFSSLSKALCD
jgi:hypothetical protein